MRIGKSGGFTNASSKLAARHQLDEKRLEKSGAGTGETA